MLTAEELKGFAKSLSIPASGVCDAGEDSALKAVLQKRRGQCPPCIFEEKEAEKRVTPADLLPGAKSIFVCLFPYYRSGIDPVNISRYAAIPDYHGIVRRYLSKIEDFIKERDPKANCLAVCDTSPLVDRWLAYRAGLGFFGKNNLLIHPQYGSWFFVGALLVTVPLAADMPMDRECLDCGACQKACPGGALDGHFGFDCERCISYLTQKKDVTEAQKKLLHGQNSVYGCDVCQAVCPHNKAVCDTPIQEFYEATLGGLDYDEIAAMSGRAYKKNYQQFPFSWCSRETILKNFNK
ncbi:MAG: tRNA epoxyqueuosine(34) reductase QueG [Ruminococcaceae bacterium]|nr:tRNA epoxyqueuosine(34) reductase QueG [Oscillospiraceae bacterium]